MTGMKSGEKRNQEESLGAYFIKEILVHLTCLIWRRNVVGKGEKGKSAHARFILVKSTRGNKNKKWEKRGTRKFFGERANIMPRVTEQESKRGGK